MRQMQAAINALVAERDALHHEKMEALRRCAALEEELAPFRAVRFYVPPGHFYSPVPSTAEIGKNRPRPPAQRPPPAGIALREREQMALVESFQAFYDEMPFQAGRTEGLRYYFENPAYSYSDAIFLHCMIRHARPRRIVEVGSGYSSCLMLDTNERSFGGAIDLTFIEPYPDLLLSLLRDGDRQRVRLVSSGLQDADMALFTGLQENDILFIDSTHVGKIGSDVNHALFNILPHLAPGVLVHVHDIFDGFEYPPDWIEQNRAWNEIYLLRAFLTFNPAFEIVVFNTFLENRHRAWFEAHMPLCLKNPGGSIWLRRGTGT